MAGPCEGWFPGMGLVSGGARLKKESKRHLIHQSRDLARDFFS